MYTPPTDLWSLISSLWAVILSLKWILSCCLPAYLTGLRYMIHPALSRLTSALPRFFCSFWRKYLCCEMFSNMVLFFQHLVLDALLPVSTSTISGSHGAWPLQGAPKLESCSEGCWPLLDLRWKIHLLILLYIQKLYLASDIDLINIRSLILYLPLPSLTAFPVLPSAAQYLSINHHCIMLYILGLSHTCSHGLFDLLDCFFSLYN